MNHLKPYPTYNDSGVSWLGELPEHWEIKSLGSLTRPLNQRGSPDLPLLSVVREKGVILRSSMSDEENRNYVPDDLSNYKVVRKGNLVINKMKAWQGSMGIASQDGIVSPAYFVYDFNIADLNFGHALLRSKPYVASFGRASDGVRVGQWDLSPADMKRILVVIPPLPEQTAIVRYLDFMDRRIRRYINAKKKLIALLNEQKQAIIHQAVTRGLDPNVRLKPSGLEWLGDIPEQWDIRRCKYIFCCVDIRSSTGEEELLTVSSDHGIIPRKSANVTMFKAESYVGYKLCWPGDLVINSLWAWARGLGVSPYHGIISSAYGVYRLRSEREDNSKFIHELVRSSSFHWELQIRSKGIWKSRLQLTDEAFLCAPFPLPPFPEQNAIVEYLDKETADIDTAINRAQREIDLLREYRTRLIADVVTGKLDVREAAASLPEEAEQPEDIEELTDSEGMPEEVALEPAIAEATDED